jgi:hypothetical protein
MVQGVAGNLVALVQIPDFGQFLPTDGKFVLILPDKIFQTGIQIESSFDSVFVQQFHKSAVIDGTVVKTQQKILGHCHSPS